MYSDAGIPTGKSAGNPSRAAILIDPLMLLFMTKNWFFINCVYV